MGVQYRFEDACFTYSDQKEKHRKYLFLGERLYGVGEGDTLRKAKINCAANAIENLEKGTQTDSAFSKEGLINYLHKQEVDKKTK